MVTPAGAEDAGPTAEELAADCPYINDYCQQRHQGVVRCSWLKAKGRILLSAKSFEPGDVIFREPPLHIIAEQKGNKAFDRLKHMCGKNKKVFEFDPLWYWTSLCSLKPSQIGGGSDLAPITEDQQRKLLLLYHPETAEPSKASKALVQEFKLGAYLQAQELERLLQVWILNCFEHSDDPLGYSAYFMSSFMSHSCAPNAVWHYEGDDFVLRARCAIADGDEISVSYLSEDSLLESVPSRRKHLNDSKHFVCSCDRCMGEKDLSRGFRCPRCEWTIFISPKLEARDGCKIPYRACERCGHLLTEAEVSTFLKEEKWLETELASSEQLERLGSGRQAAFLKGLEDVAKRAEVTLSQHWLADKTWQMLADVCARNERAEDAEDLMRKRITFQEHAFPGLSGTHAWTLEAYVDMLMRHRGVSIDPMVEVPSEQTARALLSLALQASAESVRILRLMFGEHHDYFTSVNRKFVELRKELAKHLGEAAVAV